MAPISLDRSNPWLSRERPVRAGIIGCGSFGSGILAQTGSTPLLEISAASDHDLEAARQAYLRGGVTEEEIAQCDTAGAALRAFEAGKRVIVADPLLLLGLPLEVIVEATGSPEAGARHAQIALGAGQHVAMVNKEADVAVGPFLKRLADEAGLVYTAVHGDQHGLLTALVAWACRLGLEVLCGGKSRDLEIVCDPVAATVSNGTQQIRLEAEPAHCFEPLSPEHRSDPRASIEAQLAARCAALGDWSRIGGWDLVELVIAANATGLAPDLPSGVHCPPVYASEIPQVLCPAEMGGILRSRGVIDAVTCLRRPHETGLGGGVFLVVTTATPHARKVLSRGGVCHGVDGSATLITRPYHLLGVEAIHSILTAALLGVPTAAVDYRPRFDVFAQAAKDLPAGTVLGDDHCPEITAFIGPAAPLSNDRSLPLHLANGNRLARSVTRGSVITREMVVAPAASALWTLRARQDAYFFPGS